MRVRVASCCSVNAKLGPGLPMTREIGKATQQSRIGSETLIKNNEVSSK